MTAHRQFANHRTLRSLSAATALLFGAGPALGDPLIYEPGLDPEIGFNTISWGNFGGNGAAVWTGTVQEMYDAGFRSVSLSPVRYVNPGSGVIATSSGSGPELSHVGAAVAHAKSLGMYVTVNPFVELQNFSMWRGQYNPSPGSATSNQFWSDYQSYMTDVAAMAQSNGADAMTVGTEYKAIVQDSGHNASWSTVISAIDGAFSGDLGYAANWDNYNHPNLDNAIWSHPAIDFMGIDAYFRIVSTAQAQASGARPDAAFEALVEQNWTDVLDNEILPYAAAQQGGSGLPVAFTEYGLTPFDGTVAINSNNTPDTDEQIMGFEALMRALDGRGDEILRVDVWQWGMSGAQNSQYYTNPNVTNNISGGFDERLNVPLAEWLSDFVSNTGTGRAGDFDNDGNVDANDIDALGILLGSSTPTGGERFDLDADGDIDTDDLTILLTSLVDTTAGEATGTIPGDANLDGTVGLLDLDLLGANWGTLSGWGSGDFTLDGGVTLLDLDVLGANWGDSIPFDAALAASGILVPEPAGLLAIGFPAYLYGRRRRRVVRS